MTTRFLLLGDIHLREGEQLDDIKSCLAFAGRVADEHQVDAVLFAGDFYEGKSSEAERAALAGALADLSLVPDEGVEPGTRARRTILGVKGNHDRPLELEVFAGVPDVQLVDYPCIIPVHTLGPVEHAPYGVDVLCVPWPEKAFLAANGHAGETGDQVGSVALAAMLRGMVATRGHPERPLVILAHLQVLGAITSSAQPLIGRAIETTLGDLQDLGAAAIVLGHVHKPQELAAGIEYVGSLTVHDYGEEAEQKRVGILTVEDDGAASWEWIKVPCRRWLTIEAHVVDHPGEVSYQHIEETPHLEGDAVAGMNLRFRYTCTEEEQHVFDHSELARRFAAAHTLKIVPQVERAERVRAAEVAAARSPEEKLAAWGVATGTDITEAHVGKLHELESEVSND